MDQEPIIKSKLPQAYSEQDLAIIQSKLKKLSEGSKNKTVELANLLAVLEELEKREETSGLNKWFAKDSPYSIDNLPKHKAFFNATKDHLENLMLGGNRCLAEGTLVATPKGPVAIEDLQVGDTVYDRFGKETQVVATWDNGEADIVTMTNRGKPYFSCTANHKLDCLRVARDDGNGYAYPEMFEKKEAGKLSNRNLVRRVAVKAPLGNVRVRDAYAIGAMLGDGCCTEGSSTRMVISSIDDKVPSKVASLVHAQYRKMHDSNYSWVVLNHCSYYTDWLHGRKSHEKLVDLAVLKTWDRESLLEFVAGLIDTDGSLTKSKDGHIFTLHSQNLQIIEAFRYAVLALWMCNVSVYEDKHKPYVNGNVFAASVRNPYKIREICEELFPHLVHKYKATIDDSCFGGNRSRPDALRLTAIPAGRARVYDITVAHEDHCFLLANGLSVSNSGKTTAGAYICAVVATGLYPDWWDGYVVPGPASIWACGQTGQTTRDSVQESLMGPIGAWGTGMIPKDLLIDWNLKQQPRGAIETVQIRHKDGGVSTIGFKSYDQGVHSFFGTAKHICWLDEPCDDDIYNECLVRLMKVPYSGVGRMIHTITPKKGLTRLLADYLSDCDLLEGTEQFEGLTTAKALMDYENRNNERD